jgi:MtrB/PioB family decaheme-associated outer membrane protein
MNRQPRLFSACAVACSLAAPGTLAAQQTEDPFAPLLRESRPLNTRLETDYSGVVQLGLGYVSDPNFMFGQYNGLPEDDATIIGKLNWASIGDSDSYWQISGDDLGLDTREGSVTWGKVDRVKVALGFDSQLQVRNNSGATPFRGNSQLRLPGDWVSGPTTSDWANLNPSLNNFDRELERNRYSLELTARINDDWQLSTRVDYEDKKGTSDTGAAVFNDASAGDAVLLPTEVDYSTTELDLGLLYQGDRLNLDGHLFYSDFNNREALLRWQNPYSSFGPNVRYPDGIAALGLAPDNERSSGRLSGHYRITPKARLQFDTSYSVTRQDQDFADYTINPLLSADIPVPLDSLDAEVATGIANVRFILRPLPKLNLELRYKGMDKDYDAPRAGYQYVPGDGGNQSRPALTVYNTRHDYTSQTFGIEAAYRLPLRSKLRLEYDYETIHRDNAAVDKTREGRFVAAYRIQPRQSFSTNIELHVGDRAAGTYEWAQSYYALLDTELINATPDTQRYQNHPAMSQFYLANREYLEGRLDFTFTPGVDWQLNLNLQRRKDDYDKTELGLDETSWQRLHFSASYHASEDLQLSVYGGYDQYEANQSSRAFRGGQEKNAFEVTPPLPQASDPMRNWDIDSDDTSVTLGANLNWRVVNNIELALDYSFVDTRSEQDMKAYGGAGLAPADLPAVNTALHHVQASGTWHLRDSLSIKLDYQYYRYSSDDWAWQGLGTDTIDQVLSFGERNPNEQIHYVGTSVIYRWQ